MEPTRIAKATASYRLVGAAKAAVPVNGFRPIPPKGGDNMTRRAKLQAALDALGVGITVPVGGIDGAVEFLYNETRPAEELTIEERVARLEDAVL